MAIKAKNNSNTEFMPQNAGRYWKKLTCLTKTHFVTFGYYILTNIFLKKITLFGNSIIGIGEPGRLQSMESQRVGHE